MDKKPENCYRVFAPGVPNVRVVSERLTESEAQSREGVSRCIIPVELLLKVRCQIPYSPRGETT